MNYHKAIYWATLASGVFIWVGIMAFLGYFLDLWLTISPWGFVAGMAIGIVTGFSSFIWKISKEINN